MVSRQPHRSEALAERQRLVLKGDADREELVEVSAPIVARGEKFQEAFIENRKLQFSYRAGADFHFMDTETYDDVILSQDVMGRSNGFLKENMQIVGQFYDGRLIGLELPIFVELKVAQTEPGVRGDTAKGSNKPATLETGLVVQLPLFVGPGELVKIDTRSGAYVGRA